MMRQLTSLDAQFLAMESARIYGHVSGLAVYDPSTAPGGAVTRQDVCGLVGERLHLLPPFRWRLAEVPLGLDHPYWIEDPEFDLDFHVRETSAPPPGDDRALAEQVARIVARPLDRRHPLWELYLIHGLPAGRIGMLTKIHHAAVDGVSGAEVLSMLLDLEPEGREIAPDERPGPRADRVPSQWEMLGRGLAGIPAQPVRALRAVPTSLPNLADVPGVQLVPGIGALSRTTRRLGRLVRRDSSPVLEAPQLRVPRTRFNGRITAHRRYSFGSLSLDQVKAIKNELGITVNDVVVALCATAVRDFLLSRDELPEDPLVALVPVSVRTQEQIGTFGNKVGAMICAIPTDVSDPRERLLQTHETLKVAKTRHKAIPASLMQDITQFIPPAVHARASRLTMELGAGLAPALNVVISNVPGPPLKLYCAGAELLANFPVSVITDGVGLNITCLSYRDHIDFGIVVDRDMVEDAWELWDLHVRALEELSAVLPSEDVPRSQEAPAAHAR